MAQQIQIRRGTAAAAAAADPVLAEGEQGWEVDTGVVKIGDGVTVWSALPVAFTVGVDAGVQTAAEVSFSPTGSIEATDVQAAIVELDTDLVAEGESRAAADAALGGRVGAIEDDYLQAADITSMETTTGAQAKADAAQAAAVQRANHTGLQPSTTISDFTEAVQDAVAAMLGAGSNVVLTYDDASDTLTIDSVGDGTGLDAEAVRDAIGVALVGAGLVSVAVNDALDTITISTAATANSTDAALRDRATHTGEQAIATVTGLQAALDTKADTSALATVATTGAYADLSGTPTLGTAADNAETDFATAAQGALADTAVQPAAIADMETQTGAQAKADAAQAASQPLDADLTTIAGIDSATAGALATDGAGWVRKTYAQLKTALGLVKGDVGLGNVDNTADLAKPISTATQTALDAKAPLASPALTGTPTVPTAAPGTNTTQAASTAFVKTATDNATSATVIESVGEPTAARTLQLDDAGKVIRFTFIGASTLTVPTDAAVTFPVGTVINAYAFGGGMTIAAATGVTIRNNEVSIPRYGEVSLRKDSADEWVRIG